MVHHYNTLVEALPAQERQRLLAHATKVPLLLHGLECDADARLGSVIFPTSGFVSLVVKLDDAPGLEVGMVGMEGMVGVPLGVDASTMPWNIVVQGEGAAWRIAARDYAKLLPRCPQLRQQMQSYAYVLLAQTAAMSACNRFHSVHQRLSRWLLMSHDRAQATHFVMTHEFLAYMLGVRRVSITQAASELQKLHLIQYHRGTIEIVDAVGLEAQACQCYRKSLGVYQAAFATPHVH